MNSLLKIAWRNIWRNRRRTTITIVSVVLSVFLTLLMRSVQLGSYENMIDAGIRQVGNMQLQGQGYWDSHSINDALVYDSTLKAKVESIRQIRGTAPKLESFALGSYGDQTKGVFVTGMVPEQQDSILHLSRRLIKGVYPTSNDNCILVATRLASFFGVDVGDTLVILGQGYQGITAAGKFPVGGIIKLLSPVENGTMIFMPIKCAARLFSPYEPNLVTSVAVLTGNISQTKKVEEQLKTAIMDHRQVTIMRWDQMLEIMLQQIKADNAGGVIVAGILYIIIAMGIFGTVLMGTLERRKEFSILISIGMHRTKLALVVMMESLMTGISGVATGIVLTLPIIRYYHLHPIPMSGEMGDMMAQYNIEPVMPFSDGIQMFVNQGIVVFILSVLAALYPVATVFALKIQDAIRS
ncbi:MAG: FtsX-like permease family protein [Prolixibacteraceae bacterium]|jgi:ABC-type lipoprotein release transport system permease subunit|nr:FtsX-like permease family protein [Prolixibacteraceae bacterium]